MGNILTQLGHLFVQSVPTVFLVFVLFLTLDRLLFRRLSEVLRQREELTQGALARAREQAELAETRAREYEAAFQAVRHDVYRQRDADRRQALAEREAALLQARQRADAWLAEAQADLAQQVATAKKELDSTCQALARDIAQTLLNQNAPNAHQAERQS
jgi:F0F1-type ATP synthase membrane subunit b/b'